MKKIDEGIEKILCKLCTQRDICDRKEKEFCITCERATLKIQSYLKKEGWAKLPGTYVVKKGYLERVGD